MGDDIGRRRIDLLLAKLAFAADVPRENGADAAMSRQDWSDIVAAGITTRLFPALAHRLLQPDASSRNARHLELNYGSLLRSYRYRSAAQHRMLLPVIRALNAAGVPPLLAEGAREIWLEAPAWSCVDEMAVLVPTDAIERTRHLFESLGWRRISTLDWTGYRSERCWVHPETSGYIALRGTGSNPGVERLLPHGEFERRSVVVTNGGTAARVLSPPAHCIHALLHHHVSRAGRRENTAGIRSLYEFAAAARNLSPDQTREFEGLAASDAALARIVDSWRCAALRTFGCADARDVDVQCRAGRHARLVDVAGCYAIALGEPRLPKAVPGLPRLPRWLDPRKWLRA